jgi:DNA repair ATPase RecN
MATGKRDKATRRAAAYEATIRELQAAGDYRGALHKAWEWLSEESAKVRRQRPQVSAALDAAVAEQLMKLAVSVPSFTVGEEGRRGAS